MRRQTCRSALRHSTWLRLLMGENVFLAGQSVHCFEARLRRGGLVVRMAATGVRSLGKGSPTGTIPVFRGHARESEALLLVNRKPAVQRRPKCEVMHGGRTTSANVALNRAQPRKTDDTGYPALRLGNDACRLNRHRFRSYFPSMCRTAATGWWSSMRGPAYRMTARMRSSMVGG